MDEPTETTGAVVEVSQLRRRYGGATGFEAVRGVDFTVRRGELFALLGTNGAGKTSTMEVVEGLARPTSGSVRVFGLDPVADRRRVRPRTGIMLQDGGFPGDLTVRETLRVWAGTMRAARPLAYALEAVELEGRADVRVKALSGGERRRLDLAVALLGRPELLFLDEPTAGLDPESRARTWAVVRELLGSGTTVLLTTHYLQEAEELADRLAILQRGEVVRAGTPEEVAASQPARIRFRVPAGTPPVPRLGQLPSTSGEVGAGGARREVLQTYALQATLRSLLEWADAQGVALDGLDARSASLEEAFLAVAGSEHGRGSDRQEAAA